MRKKCFLKTITLLGGCASLAACIYNPNPRPMPIKYNPGICDIDSRYCPRGYSRTAHGYNIRDPHVTPPDTRLAYGGHAPRIYGKPKVQVEPIVKPVTASRNYAGADDGTYDYEPDCSKGEASTLVCASRTWNRCFAYRDPAYCEKVGFKGMVFIDPNTKGTGKEKTLPPVELSKRKHEIVHNILGVKEVSPDRFNYDADGKPISVDDKLMGTHEIMFKNEVCDASGCTNVITSEFYKKVNGKWQITSWTVGEDICEGKSYKEEPDCRINIPSLKQPDK